MENIRLKIFFITFYFFLGISLANFVKSLDSLADGTVKEEKNLEKEEKNLETYIVFLSKPEGSGFKESKDLDEWYESFLPVKTFGSEQPRLAHSYHHVVTGFAAKLTAEDVKGMEKKDGFVSARPTRMVPLHTTHTPSLLGLEDGYGLWTSSNKGKGIIVGLVDSGITPDHPSFRDDGMPKPPAKWKGKCDNATLCNNKLIGVRNFATDSNNTADEYMHGTHTASTAAGSPFLNASYFGQANGTAIGMAPLAHLAMYKVSGRASEAGEAEILAAMDAAIDDGVDVLSLSLGIGSRSFYDDVIAIGSYAAIQKGIFVSCSAGNGGPDNSSLSNEAPWILTVGASTVDRAIRSTVSLGNNAKFDGETFFQPKGIPTTLLPLVYSPGKDNIPEASCEPDSLKNFDIKGKIVLCEGAGFEDTYKGQAVKDNGGAGMILMNFEEDGFITTPQPHVLPASNVDYVSGSDIKAYINSSSTPTATILFKGTVVGAEVPNAPQIAEFSSRGPSLASPGILKPDIIGPGVRILAAWPVSEDNTANRLAMISGTSMSCPHLSGISALLKNSHPNWSPAAIKSAIMTTADINNVGGRPISDQQFVPATLFDMGAGHVNPSKANDPGLIYDIKPADYIPYLCGLGYSDKQIGTIVQKTVKCSNDTSIPEAQLNYPSFSIKLGSSPKNYSRTVTNVGKPASTYTAKITAPQGVDVKVTPDAIKFDALNQNASYTVIFSPNGKASGSCSQGYLTWVSESYSVTSPIAVVFG